MSSAGITSSFFTRLPSFVISRNTNIDCVLILNFYLLLAFKCSFNKNGFNFNDDSKICFSRASEVKGIFNKAYDVVSFAYSVPNKKLLCDSNYIVDVAMWPKFGNSSILWEKLSWAQFYKNLMKKKKKMFWGVLLVQAQ